MKRLLTLGGIVIAVLLSSCGGGDDETTTTEPPSGGVEAPSGTAPPSSGVGALPPAFVECMADQGYEIESSADIHSAPQQVLQACFGSFHQGG